MKPRERFRGGFRNLDLENFEVGFRSKKRGGFLSDNFWATLAWFGSKLQFFLPELPIDCDYVVVHGISFFDRVTLVVLYLLRFCGDIFFNSLARRRMSVLLFPIVACREAKEQQKGKF
jgi:hypothetical protein